VIYDPLAQVITISDMSATLGRRWSQFSLRGLLLAVSNSKCNTINGPNPAASDITR
jgi:hypothetical protein